MPKSKNLDGAWEGWGTTLKPAHEPICVARKPLSVPSITENVQKHGVGAMNIEACKVIGEEGAAGRWPSNVVLLHLPKCELVMSDLGVSWRCSPGCPVAALNEQSGIRKSGDTPLKRNPDKFRDVYGDFKGQESCGFVREGSAGGASRFFFTSKASPEERWLYCKTYRVAERRTIFKKNSDCPRHGSNPKTMDLGPIFGGTENPECLCWENAAEAHAQHERDASIDQAGRIDGVDDPACDASQGHRS